jgi:Ca2+-binding EF-hand superfamily protein
MKNKQILGVSMVCMLAWSAPALADTFSILDKSQDNVLTFGEYNNSANTARFSSVDANGDGLITRNEFNNYDRTGYNYNRTGYSYNRTGMSQWMPWRDRSDRSQLSSFSRLDRNGNGLISRREFWVSDANVPFSAVDRDGNGYITRRELNRYLERHSYMR